MREFLGQFGFRFTTAHLLWAAVLIPAVVVVSIPMNLLWLGITLGVLIAIATTLTIRGRRLTGWIAALFSWRRRHTVAPPAPSADPVRPRSGFTCHCGTYCPAATCLRTSSPAVSRPPDVSGRRRTAHLIHRSSMAGPRRNKPVSAPNLSSC